MPIDKARDISTFSEEAWQEAKRRAEFIRPLAAGKHCSQSSIGNAVLQLGLSERQVYALVKRCRARDGALDALVPSVSNGGKGGTRVSNDQESFVSELIDDLYTPTFVRCRRERYLP